MKDQKQRLVISFVVLLIVGVGIYLSLKIKRFQAPFEIAIADSFIQPIPTVAVGGTAFAVLPPDLISAVDLQVSAYKTYGLSRGWLAFSELQDGFPDVKLHVINLKTQEEKLLLSGWMVYGAVWRPGGLTLAVGANDINNSASALLFVDAKTNEIIRRINSTVSLIRWSEDGSILYALQEIHPPDQRSPEESLLSFVSYSTTGELLGERLVDYDMRGVLPALDDTTLNDVLKYANNFPWEKVPKVLNVKGGLGVSLQNMGVGKQLYLGVIWRMADVLLVENYSDGSNSMDLKSINMISGEISSIITTSLVK